MQWFLSLKLVVLLTVARVFGERFNQPLDGGIAFFDKQPIFGRLKTIRGIILSLVAATAFLKPLVNRKAKPLQRQS